MNRLWHPNPSIETTFNRNNKTELVEFLSLLSLWDPQHLFCLENTGMIRHKRNPSVNVYFPGGENKNKIIVHFQLNNIE